MCVSIYRFLSQNTLYVVCAIFIQVVPFELRNKISVVDFYFVKYFRTNR